MRSMTIMHPNLLAEIEAFLSETGMGETYFGKRSVGNSEVVSRLRDGKRVWPDTETRIRSFILSRRNALHEKRGNETKPRQGSGIRDQGSAA